jgi:sulfite exporter TauE/SafE
MGNTICILSACALSPVLYLSAINPGLKRTVWLVALFSFARIITYAALGMAAGAFGLMLDKLIGSSVFSLLVGLFTGAINILIGFSIVIGQHSARCSRLCRYTDGFLQHGYGIVLLGVFLAIIPCAPFMSFFIQAMAQRAGLLAGALSGALFGIGITLSVPFWLLVLFSGSLPDRILKNDRVLRTFRIICGGILVVIGLRYIISAVA